MGKSITIIITVYNKEIYLGYCFKLLKEQLLKLDMLNQNRVDLLIINDCSTDDSIIKIEGILNNEVKYRVIHNDSRKNIAYVRWQALNEVEGDYFIFIDADDLITENYIEDLLNTDFSLEADIYQFQGREYPNGVLMGFDSTWSPLKLIKTSFIKDNNINYDPSYPIGVDDCVGGEDTEFYNRLIKLSPYIVNVEKIIVIWNFAVPDSLTKINYSYLHWISKE